MTKIEPTFDIENELPIPTIWRSTLEMIVESFSSRERFMALQNVKNIKVDEKSFNISRFQIVEYPATVVSIGAESWKNSICRWMGEYWDILVDLYVDDIDEISDLVLGARVFPVEEGYRYEIGLVYVP